MGEGAVRIHPEDWLYELDIDSHFERCAPLEVDVGCGKGAFLLSQAAARPEHNFLGIDRMLRRIRKLANKAERAGLENLRLLRIDAAYALSHMMPAASVSVYYVFFPDPWPKKRHHGKRFFDAAFLAAIRRSLKPGGLIHTATDHMPYFEDIENLLESDPAFRRVETFAPGREERTEFERYYVEQTQIGRASFQRLS